jgi:hypothetical protein
MVDITIQHKRSAQAGKAPTTAQLELGEIALNTRDGELYMKKDVDGVESVVKLLSSLSGAQTDFIDVLNKPTTIAGYGITDAFDGDYDNLTDKPDLTLYQLIENAFNGDYNNLYNAPNLFDGQFTSLIGLPTTIAGYGITDAFSGDYSDLANTPFIPVDLTDLTDTSGILVPFSGSYNDLTDTPFIPVALSDISNVANTAPQVGEVLKWSGSSWGPGVDTGDTNADTLDGQHGAYYVDWANANNTPTTLAGYGITDALPAGTTTLTDIQISEGSADQVLGTNGAGTYSFVNGIKSITVSNAAAGTSSLTYDSANGVFTFTPADLSSYLTSYTETSTLDNVISRGNTTTTTAVIPFEYGSQLAFPSANTYNGAVAISDADQEVFFSNGGSWLPLQKRFNEDSRIVGKSTTFSAGITTTSGSYLRGEAVAGDNGLGPNIQTSLTVSEGFTRIKVELDASIANVTNNASEIVVVLERNINGQNPTDLKQFVFPPSSTYYGSQHFLFVDTHGGNAGDIVAYKLRVDMSAYSNESARMQFGICGDTMYIKEMA